MRNCLKLLLCMLYALSALQMNAEDNVGYFAFKKVKAKTASPPAGFNYTTNGSCAPVVAQFYSQVAPGSNPYEWNFGDTSTNTDTSNLCNPTYIFTKPGVYTVKHKVGTQVYTQIITVGSVPVVNFFGSQTTCLDATENYSVSVSSPIASYFWSAVGGQIISPTSTTTSVKWTSFGINELKYTVTTTDGCTKVFSYKVKVLAPPMVELPCCPKRQSGVENKDPSNPHQTIPGGPGNCEVCANSYACYNVYMLPESGVASDYTFTWTVVGAASYTVSTDGTECCVLWGSAGVGKITVVAEHTVYHCKSKKECDIKINPGIAPDFNVSGACINDPVSFQANSFGTLQDIQSFFWEFGDGEEFNSGTSPSTTHSFNSAGNYTATLTVTSINGCVYKVKKTFSIISGTKPTIICPGTVCEGSRACYSTTNVGIPANQYQWIVSGDINAQFTQNAVGNEICVTWGNGPTGKIELTVNSSTYTCANTVSEIIPIVSTTIPISGNKYICTDATWLSYTTEKYSGACYEWFVKNNNVTTQITGADANSVLINASSYANTFEVIVKVNFGLGCCHGEGVYEVKKVPKYTLNQYINTVCIGTQQTYTLAYTNGIPNPPVSWIVYGGIVNSQTPTSVTVTWNTAGIGTITASNNSPMQYCNNADNSTWSINVQPKVTGASITGPSKVCKGTSNAFFHAYDPSKISGISVSTSAGGGASIVTSAYSSNITFNVVGNYTITVNYTNTLLPGCSDPQMFNVTVIDNAIPTFVIPPNTVCKDDVVTYLTAGINLTDYEVSVIGGTVLGQTVSSGVLTSITVQWNSTITSKIIVKNKVCNTQNEQNITVNGKPIAIISSSKIVCGTTTDTLSVANIWFGYQWKNSSNTLISTSSSTIITTAGTYSVEISNGVCTDKAYITVPIVTPVGPTINTVVASPSAVICCPRDYTMVPTVTIGSGAIVSYAWTFSAGSISTANVQNPVIAVGNGVVVNYTLTVVDVYGCSKTYSGSFTGNCTGVCPGGPGSGCTFTGSVSNLTYDPCTGKFGITATNVQSLSWNFKDGTYGSGLNPTKFYTSPCGKVVDITAVDLAGCAKLFTFNFNVPYVFNPSIYINNNKCTGAISATANGMQACSTTTVTQTWLWEISGNGISPLNINTTSGTLQLSTLVIPNGNYTLKLTWTVNGCTKIVTTTFNKGGLVAKFILCSGVCAESAVNFADLTNVYLAPNIYWKWDFTPVSPSGPTISSFLQNPTITFPTSGTWNITLTVKNNNGCSSSYTLTNFVVNPPLNPLPIVVKNGTTTVAGTSFLICKGEPYTLQAPAGYNYAWSNGATTQIISVTEEGDYYVTVQSGTCAKKLGPIKFTFKPSPIAEIIPTSNACAPRLVNAFQGVGYNYSWTYSGSPNFNSYIQLNQSETVTLDVVNVFGCISTATLAINVNPSPTVFISQSAPFCPPTTINLTANINANGLSYNTLWSNGLTTDVISISTPNKYKVTVTDVNGCKAKASINIQPVYPDGIELLPYGCYNICNDVTMCAGKCPWGYTAQWYFNNTPIGSVLNAGDNLALTILYSNGNGTYNLHYTPTTANSSACPYISKDVNITTVVIPNPVITSSNGTIVSSAQPNLLTVNPQLSNYIYTWYLNGNVVGTGYTYSATQPGLYKVKMYFSDCCFGEDTIALTGCSCFDSLVPFKYINAPYTVSSNEFWDGKYYIDAVVTVIGNAELDLTNVDLAFSPRGYIRFKNKSVVRINNSVLRPCFKDSIWPGLDFEDSSYGWINTSTFKNARNATEFIGNKGGVRISSNHFVKCNNSVVFNNSINQKSVANNHFEFDETILPYGTLDNWGIRILNSQMLGIINNNDFNDNKTEIGTGLRYYGIYSQFAYFTANDNHFNNMYRSIDVTNSTNVVAIEKNNFNISNLQSDVDQYQVRITYNVLPVIVMQNKFSKAFREDINAGAIFALRNKRPLFKENEIDGFGLGIVTFGNLWPFVTTNKITNSTRIAAASVLDEHLVASCNSIDNMHTQNSINGFSGPTGLLFLSSSSNSYIYSNCIMNSRDAAIFWSILGVQDLPQIRNNFFYNYIDNGIVVSNYSGAIGMPGSSIDAGRNTLMSNNFGGGAIDINSVTPIVQEGGNFGIMALNNVTSLGPPDEYYSTASCAHQIQGTYGSNLLDKYNVCDVYDLEDFIDISEWNLYKLKREEKDIDETYINNLLNIGRGEVFGNLRSAFAKPNANLAQLAKVILASNMNKEDALQLISVSLIGQGKLDLLEQILSENSTNNSTVNLVKTYQNAVQLIKQKYQITKDQIVELSTVDAAHTEHSQLAKDLLQAAIFNNDFRFPKIQEITVPKAQHVMVKNKNTFTVYPVPAKDKVSVKFNAKTFVPKSIEIRTITGALVTNYSTQFYQGKIELYIPQLANGIYIVNLIASDGKTKQTGRIIKN